MSFFHSLFRVYYFGHKSSDGMSLCKEFTVLCQVFLPHSLPPSLLSPVPPPLLRTPSLPPSIPPPLSRSPYSLPHTLLSLPPFLKDYLPASLPPSQHHSSFPSFLNFFLTLYALGIRWLHFFSVNIYFLSLGN